jgi:hypothetical protein
MFKFCKNKQKFYKIRKSARMHVVMYYLTSLKLFSAIELHCLFHYIITQQAKCGLRNAPL